MLHATRALPILFNTPQKIPTQIKVPKKIHAKFFLQKKKPESKLSNPKKSFDHPSHLKS